MHKEEVMSTKKPLRESLKRMLEEDGLSEGEITQLQMVQQATPANNYWFAIQRLARPVNLAAASFILVCLLVAGNFYQWRSGDNTQQRIAQEVLINHIKIKKLDLETSSMTELINYFERLNFSPFYSKLLEGAEFRLLGARYCTLQGVIALQYRFLSPGGNVVTYYQALYDKERFGRLPDTKNNQTPHVVNAQGFTVSIWREDGVVTVLAKAGQ